MSKPISTLPPHTELELEAETLTSGDSPNFHFFPVLLELPLSPSIPSPLH
jgi:hypothetical protein